jgi:hypothetical protein
MPRPAAKARAVLPRGPGVGGEKQAGGGAVKQTRPATQPGRTSGGQTSGGRPRNTFNPIEGPYSEKQVQHLEQEYGKKLENAELTPYRAEGKEIAQNEQGAIQRFGQDATADNSMLASIAQDQEASAKTAENQAADTALQAGKAIETSGQNQASMTNGYMTPELRAQLNAEANQSVQAGAAGNTLAQNMAQAGGNLIAGIRGAAVLQAVEGKDRMTNYFQKQQAKVNTEEGKVIPKVAAATAKYGMEAGQKSFADTLAQDKLVNEGVKISQTGSADKSKAEHEAAENRKYAVEIPQREAQTQKINSELSKQPFYEWAKRNEIAISKMSTEDKKKYDEAQLKVKEGGQGSVADGLKYMNTVESALGYAKRFIQDETAKHPNFTTQQVYNLVREQLQAGSGTGKEGEGGKGYNPSVVGAAMNLAVYGRLGTVEQAEALAQGLPVKQKPQWFRSGNEQAAPKLPKAPSKATRK